MESGALTSDWLSAYEAVPRHLFVPEVIWPGRAGMNRQHDRVTMAEDPDMWWEAVYRDAPITTQWDGGEYTGPGKGRTPTSSNSMPTMVFSMLAALDVQEGQSVLEIGTGTGWNAGLLSQRLGGDNVVSVEVDRTTAEAANNRLRLAGLLPLVVVGDGADGYADAASYDRVIATCSVGSVPAAWREQTVTGGVIVTPWGPTYGGEAVARLTVSKDGSASGPFVGSSAFMRMSVQRKTFPPTRAFLDGDEWPGSGVRSETALSPDDAGDWVHMFAVGVQVPDLFCRVEQLEGAAYRLWVLDTGITAWATADYEPGRTRYPVVQSGARRLWDELELAWRWWDRQGRPGFDRFGLTVDSEGERVWLDSPDQPVPVKA
ncbi:protein-L-isoaspartate(D-aspartate) O-methyltransferase [Streptomyces silvensis]|uniref:Protein-L-isoaspartate O-methyltransferase n=1 Tax=Streptomyces silvensis TaxID=1765722 RepID=A0A0W7XBH8_9ACTN|nr:protein-L-isoaspartate(D-aspartate) O-methyltransferase [Streptomyces silvensis]